MIRDGRVKRVGSVSVGVGHSMGCEIDVGVLPFPGGPYFIQALT